MCPVHQTCGIPEMDFNCVYVLTILVQVVVAKRGIGDWLLAEVPARNGLEYVWVAEMLLDAEF